MLSIKDWTRVLRSYDSNLYAQETKPGSVDIYRQNRDSSAPPHFRCSLSDTWQPQGKPLWYGQDVVLNRIKAHDLWRDDTFLENFFKETEKIEESKRNAFKNSVESFLYDFRRDFQKATDGIRTANMKKLYRKEGSHGYCEPRS